jgi:plastocyanin
MKARCKLFFVLAALLLTGISIARAEEEFVIDQKDKTFLYKDDKIETLKIKVGDTVRFRNMDPYFHNVFSLSDAQIFDLGSYPRGQSKAVKFLKPGKVLVECAIHPQMHMVVEVKP